MRCARPREIDWRGRRGTPPTWLSRAVATAAAKTAVTPRVRRRPPPPPRRRLHPPADAWRKRGLTGNAAKKEESKKRSRRRGGGEVDRCRDYLHLRDGRHTDNTQCCFIETSIFSTLSKCFFKSFSGNMNFSILMGKENKSVLICS